MAQTKRFGVWTALVTPFSETGEIDWASFGRLLAHQKSGGVDGVVVCGTTGETPTLNDTERTQLIQHTVKYFAGSPIQVMVGTGSNSTATTVKLSREAQALGAHSLLVVTPYYNKPTARGLLDYYTQTADSVSLPIYLYNVPGRTGVSLPLDVTATLSQKSNIAGIKEASGSVLQFSELQQRVSSQFQLISGDDPLFVPGMSLGAQGIISVASNWIPKVIVEIDRTFAAGDTTKALALHNRYYPIFRDLFIESNPAPIKWVLHKAGILTSPTLRSPLAALTGESVRCLDKHLETLR